MAHENATPRPWAVDGEGIRTMVRGDDLTIVAVRHRNPAENHAANAALIVEAVNAYDTLRAENAFLWDALGRAKYALTKASLSEAEALRDAKRIITASLSEAAS